MVLHVILEYGPTSREQRNYYTSYTTRSRRFTRINYGTKSVAEIFQEEISEALDGLEGAINISDDILAHETNEEEHDDRAKKVLKRCREQDIRLGSEKYQFNCTELVCYGYVFTGSGI